MLVIVSIIVIIILIMFTCFRIVPQNTVGLLETLGKYSSTRSTGLNFRLPVIQKNQGRVTGFATFEVGRLFRDYQG